MVRLSRHIWPWPWLCQNHSVNVTKAEWGECMLLMKMPSKESVDLALSCQLHLAMKDLELLKPVNKLFWGGVFSTEKKKKREDCTGGTCIYCLSVQRRALISSTWVSTLAVGCMTIHWSPLKTIIRWHAKYLSREVSGALEERLLRLVLHVSSAREDFWMAVIKHKQRNSLKKLLGFCMSWGRMDL